MATYSPSKITKDGNTYNFTDTTKIPLTGTSALAGSIIPDTDNAYNLGDSTYGFASFYANKIYLKGSTIFNVVDDNYICVGGATTQANGANLVLNGKNRSTSAGEFKLEARDGTNTKQLIGKPDGTLSWNGNIIPSTNNAYDLGNPSCAFKTGFLNDIRSLKTTETIFGFYNDGADLVLCPYGYNNGRFLLRCYDGTNRYALQGNSNGTLTWGSKNVAMQEDTVPRSGGAVLSGQEYKRTVDNSTLNVYGGNGFGHGAFLQLTGKDETGAGDFNIQAHDGTNATILKGKANGTLTWNGQAIQTTSDKRLKQQISNIDDKLLDAWEDVELSQFKYNDAVNKKSDNARLHTGYVVQQIDEACKSHNVDVSKYGLYCHEVYQEETREVEHDDGTKTVEVVRPANEHYSLRYTEALIIECAFLRKKLKELTARIEQLEKGNNSK